MEGLLTWFISIAAIVAALANIALWSRRRRRMKVVALILVALFMPISYLAMVDLLSRPKPMSMEWSPPGKDDAKLLGAKMEEDVAIYIWVQRDGAREPRAYKLPWSEEMARQLHESQRSAERDGSDVQVRMRKGQQQIDGERMFYAKPRQALPPKQVASDN